MRLSSLAGAEEPASWLAAETWLVCMSAAVEEAAAAGSEAALLFAPAPLFFPPAVALYQHNITKHKNLLRSYSVLNAIELCICVSYIANVFVAIVLLCDIWVTYIVARRCLRS